MSFRLRLTGLLCTALLLSSYLAFVKVNPKPSSSDVEHTASPDLPRDRVVSPSVQAVGNPAKAFNETVVHINPSEVLATVNGRKIRLADLMPMSSTETNNDRKLSLVTYKYLLDRAIKRELVLQTAKAQGVELNESQTQQLADFRAERKLLGPGLVQQLNADPQQLSFENQDETAFMLQTELLARNGYSPNVSEDEVQTYYNQHADDFASLPADEPERSQAWASISYQIRTMLAPGKREQFQAELTAYLDQLESGAQISLAANP